MFGVLSVRKIPRLTAPDVPALTGGPEALAMVAARLGLALSAPQLRREAGLEPGAVALPRLLRIADTAGLKARQVRLSWDDLCRLDTAFPAILALTDGSCVVAERFVPGETPVVIIRDPCRPEAGALPVDELRLAGVWSGTVILAKRRTAPRDEDQPFGFGWMLAQMLRERALFRDLGLAAIIMSVLTLVPPMLYMVVVDRVLVHHRLSTLTVLAIGIAVLLAFETALGWLRRSIVAVIAAKIDARASLYLFDRLIGLPIDFFDHNATGIIAHKLGEVRRVRMFLTGQVFGGILDATTLLVLIPAMFVLSPPLATFVVLVGAAMALVILAYMGPVKRAYARVVTAEQRKSSMLIETIQGMRTVKTLALEGRRRREWDARVGEAVRAATALQDLANQPQTLLAPLEKLIYAGSLCLGAFLAIEADSVVYAGTLVAFTMIATRATQPIMQLAGMMQQVQEARGALAEVASVVNVQPEPRRANGVRPDIGGAIEFLEVGFTYGGAATPALDGLSLAIEPGQIVGLMGRSGSGKTTVTRLLQGLHPAYRGLIKLDGVDLREIDIDHLRSHMGVVLQDSFLFKGTIRDNILLGRPEASPAEMVAAARLAGAEEFIERLPRGYETEIEEGASNLSGGQRQRLAIARALVMDPPLLIFDEATSALDPDSEAIISGNLRQIARGRTVIMISHRLASLTDCDQILVLDRGRLKDAGRHEALLERCDTYRHLWFQQNRHLAPGPVHDRLPPSAARRAE